MLTVAVGNSSTRAAVWSAEGNVLWSRDWPTTSPITDLADGICARVRESPDCIRACVLAGVVPRVTRSLNTLLGHRLPGVKVLRFRRDLHCPLRIAPRPAQRVGDDRLAGTLGALVHDPGVSWVVIDAGTAVTVNAVRGGCFEGGMIIPGEELALRALSTGTAQLPSLKPWPADRPTKVFGLSTAEAMRCGVRNGQIGAVCNLVVVQTVFLGPGTRVVVTGGGAAPLWPMLEGMLGRCQPIFDPHLVLRGLFAAWKSAQG